MKKTFLTIVIALAVLIASPAMADAKSPTNAEKNLGNVICASFRLVAVPLNALGKAVKGKPAKVLLIPRDVRREAFDGVESLVRVPFAPAIDKEAGEMGAVNSGIAEANLDWLVDGVLYGVAGGTLWWNEGNAGVMSHEFLQQSWTAGIAIGAGTVLLDVGGAAVDVE